MYQLGTNSAFIYTHRVGAVRILLQRLEVALRFADFVDHDDLIFRYIAVKSDKSETRRKKTHKHQRNKFYKFILIIKDIFWSACEKNS